MGMYDTINDEQVKIFYVPCISLNDGPMANNSCVTYSGGSLDYFDKNDEIPYVTYWYNLGKDFNIIDLFPYEHDYSIVHIIRNGKNQGIKLLKELTDNDFCFSTYDDHGNKLNFSNLNEVNDYKQILDDIKNIQKTLCYSAWHNYMQYLRTMKDNVVLEELEELTYQMKLEQRQNDLKLKPFIEKKEKYLCADILGNDFSTFGSLIYGLQNKRFENILNGEYDFCITDDRLTFIVAYNELKIYLDKGDQFLKDYFNTMQLPYYMAEKIINDILEIQEKYEKMQKVVIPKDKISEAYLLVDILNGRYKEHYLKYNVLPFEGFDYDSWKYLKQEQKTAETIYDKVDKIVEERIKNFINNEELCI